MSWNDWPGAWPIPGGASKPAPTNTLHEWVVIAWIQKLHAQGVPWDRIRKIVSFNGTRPLTRAELTAIGYRPERIKQILKNQSGGTSGGTGGKSGPGVVPQNPSSIPASQQADAFANLSAFFSTWGIPIGADIEAILRKAAKDGTTNIQLIMPEIQKTASWQARFPGWDQRVKNGWNQIDVGTYLQLEDQYHSILEQYGLPKSFYDSPGDFGNWIANNVAPAEIENRVQMATDMVNKVDPAARDLLTKFYGVGSGDLAAYFLDRTRALPAIERQYKAVNVAQWAVKNGLKVFDPKYYENLVDAGITPEMAMQGYSTVKTFNDTLGQIGSIYGDAYSQLDAENDVFFGQSDKRKAIVRKEIATFSGQSAGSTGTAQRSDY